LHRAKLGLGAVMASPSRLDLLGLRVCHKQQAGYYSNPYCVTVASFRRSTVIAHQLLMDLHHWKKFDLRPWIARVIAGVRALVNVNAIIFSQAKHCKPKRASIVGFVSGRTIYTLKNRRNVPAGTFKSLFARPAA